MGASCGGDTKPEEEPVYAAVGLQTHHAYSVLDVKDIHGIRLAGHVLSSYTFAGCTKQFVSRVCKISAGEQDYGKVKKKILVKRKSCFVRQCKRSACLCRYLSLHKMQAKI